MAGRQGSRPVSTKQARIANIAKLNRGAAIRSLSHHIDLDWMREAYRQTRKDGAVGIDGQTAASYAEDLESNLLSLIDRAKGGAYRAPPVRRVEIPKGGGRTRPIGIPTFEDKVLQRAVKMLLEPLYEQDFYDFSYGFRPHRSARDGLEAVRAALHELQGGVVLDADVSMFFDTLDHKQLRDLLRRRVADGVVVRLVGKWLNAGVLSEGRVTRSDVGTPQGGVISPLLANIYLHEVLDRWWVEDVQPRLRGRAFLIRYADDFVMAFEEESDAQRVREVLHHRFARFGLTLHPDKTRLVRFHPPSRDDEPRSGTFDFVGFTLHWGRARKTGHWVVRSRTASSRVSRFVRSIFEWMKRVRHRPIPQQAKALGAKLLGHYNYYGVPGNGPRLEAVRRAVTKKWWKALRRRSQRGLQWRQFLSMLKRYPLPKARTRPTRPQLRLANV